MKSTTNPNSPTAGIYALVGEKLVNVKQGKKIPTNSKIWIRVKVVDQREFDNILRFSGSCPPDEVLNGIMFGIFEMQGVSNWVGGGRSLEDGEGTLDGFVEFLNHFRAPGSNAALLWGYGLKAFPVDRRTRMLELAKL